MKFFVVGTFLTLATILSVPAFSELDAKTYAEAKNLGLKINSAWQPSSIKIFRHEKGFPVLVDFWATTIKNPGEGYDNVHIVFYRKDASQIKFRPFYLGRNLDIKFSPSGEKVIVRDNSSAGETDLYMAPISAFDLAKIDPVDNPDEVAKMDFYSLSKDQVVYLSDIVEKRLRNISNCGWYTYSSPGWNDDDHVLVHLEVGDCDGEKGIGHGKWTGIVNLKTREFESVKEIEKKGF